MKRRSFIKGIGVASAALSTGGLLGSLKLQAEEDEKSGRLEPGDAAILRFLAAIETIETDLWQQYAELGGNQTNEPPQITGLTGGNAAYIRALQNLDGDMPQYIHDNTEDEFSHQDFINSYLASKGADTADLKSFRNLPSSQATGAQNIGRLTNLMELTVDTSWWTRYRSRTKNPDLGDTFTNAIKVLGTKKHTAIPRNNNEAQLDSSSPNGVTDLTQYIANTAGFHFAFIEQGGTSLYAQLAQRVSHSEVLRILLSIGGTEIMHFQTWHDKAGNCPPLKGVKDPVSGDTVDFPDISKFAGNEDLQANLIMPEPTSFLNRKFPPVSIIRPTATKGAAAATVKAFIDDGLFLRQSPAFFKYINDLAEDADEARRRD
ncbi:ferritin-like domain-containing protein [Alloacidobacterium dinghuense]|uniref:Ferritin-like domain-containing protein n=1 Tax=Alloacidobacterium dinghuense TaxID=2763107 RepID=A0A7G8BQV5_9BACT|nr:ferritin-like domain-containing protein [Alloacidobacterium dinghuense]